MYVREVLGTKSLKTDPDSKGLRRYVLADDVGLDGLKTDPDSKGLRLHALRHVCLHLKFKNRP